MMADRLRIVSGGRLDKSPLQMTFGGKVSVGASNLVARNLMSKGGRHNMSPLQMTFAGNVGVGATNLAARRSASERHRTCFSH